MVLDSNSSPTVQINDWCVSKTAGNKLKPRGNKVYCAGKSQEGDVWRSQPAQKKNECQRSWEDNKRGADERGALVERGAIHLLSSHHIFQLWQEGVRTQTALSLNTWHIKHKFLSTPVPTICSSHKQQPWIWYVRPGRTPCLTNNTGHSSKWSHWRANLRRVTDTETLHPCQASPMDAPEHTQRHKEKTLPTCLSCGRAVHMLGNDRPTLRRMDGNPDTFDAYAHALFPQRSARPVTHNENPALCAHYNPDQHGWNEKLTLNFSNSSRWEGSLQL